MPQVKVADLGEDYLPAVREVFEHFGGIGALAPEGATVYVKPNAIGYDPEHHTTVPMLAAVFQYLRDAGFDRIVLFENCTNGNITRLVFHVTGYFRLCRKYGVKTLLLDEDRTVPVVLDKEEHPVDFPATLNRELLENRSGNFYISVPKFKTHPMTVLTLGIKNQQGLLADRDKMHNHSHAGLHRRLVDIYTFIRPDFSIVDGRHIMRYGHFSARNHLAENLVRADVVFGGPDAVAVDAVGARILGYDPSEVEHVRLAGAEGLGEADLSKIEISGDLSRFTERIPCQTRCLFPPDVRVVTGKEMACVEGCRGNPEVFIEYLYGDFKGRGGWTLVCGKGIDRAELEGIGDGPILINGPCAAGEVADYLKAKYPKTDIRVVPEHNDLARMAAVVKDFMGISTLRMAPVNPVTALWLLMRAKLGGCNSRTPPIFG